VQRLSPPRFLSPPPTRETSFRVVLALTLGLALVFLLRNLEEARILDPSLLHSLMTQGGTLALAPYRLDALPRPLLMDPALEFGLMGYLVVLMMLPAKLLLGAVFTPTGVALTRSFVAFMNLAGGPLLYLLGRRRGLPPGTSLLVAMLYLGNPFLLDKVSWDILGCQGTFLIAAGLALASSRPWLAFPAWLLAAGGHPVSTFGATLWALREVHARRGDPVAARRPYLVAAGVLALLSLLFFLDLFLPPLLDRYSGFSLTFALKVGGPGPLQALPTHLLSLLGFLASFGFLPLAAPGWLLPAIPDGLYYLVLGTNHGSLPGTTGLLALASVEGMRRLQDAMSRPGARARLRWLAPSGDLRPMAAAVAGMLLLAANLHGDPRNHLRRLLHPPRWDGAWVPEAEALARSLPETPDLCVVQVPLLPLVQGRCAQEQPFGSWAERMPWERRRAFFLFHVDLFDADRFVSRWTPDHEALRQELCGRYRKGLLAVHRAVGGALFVGPPADPGTAPTRHPQMDWLCRFQ